MSADPSLRLPYKLLMLTLISTLAADHHPHLRNCPTCYLLSCRTVCSATPFRAVESVLHAVFYGRFSCQTSLHQVRFWGALIPFLERRVFETHESVAAYGKMRQDSVYKTLPSPGNRIHTRSLCAVKAPLGVRHTSHSDVHRSLAQFLRCTGFCQSEEGLGTVCRSFRPQRWGSFLIIGCAA